MKPLALPKITLHPKPKPIADKPPGWPWVRADQRPHGWYIDGNATLYGPLPERVRLAKPSEPPAPKRPAPRLIDPWRERR